jgi:deoxyadenosine/deoxycytidine kinase
MVFTFQQVVNASLARRYQQSSAEMARGWFSPVRVFERSLRVAGEVFVEAGRNIMDEVDVSILQHMAATLSNIFEGDATHVYLSCSAEEMLRRVRSRDREAERSMT